MTLAWDTPLEEAPPQFSTGDRCTECKRPLSMYNPYVVCGPCRVELSTVTHDFAEDDEPDRYPVVSYTWERFAKRKPLRSGPLLAETVPQEAEAPPPAEDAA